MAADGFLNNFKAKVGDLSRAYLFYINIQNSGSGAFNFNDHKYLVRSASLPETTIEPIVVPFQGMEFMNGTSS